MEEVVMEKEVKRGVWLGSRRLGWAVEVGLRYASCDHPGPILPQNVLHSQLIISDLDDTMIY